MAAFTAKDVAALREKTGCGMMDCKKALTEANGDMDAAIDFLRERAWLLPPRRLAVLQQKALPMPAPMKLAMLALQSKSMQRLTLLQRTQISRTL